MRSQKLRLVIAGLGRAGGALTIAAEGAGHEIAGLFSKSARFESHLPMPVHSYSDLTADQPLPPCDLLVVAVRDTAIASVAGILAPAAGHVGAAVHMSGFESVAALEPLAKVGLPTGSFHPLQSLPDPVHGAQALAGSWVALTGGESLTDTLTSLAASLGMTAFSLADGAKPLYHAGAAAASNYVIAALDLACSLMAAADVPFEAVAPLTSTAVKNAFAMSPRIALTGPIARDDWQTVAGQLAAVGQLGPELARQFRLMAEATAITAGRELPEDL